MEKPKLRFIVFKGNNHRLIRNACLDKGWVEANDGLTKGSAGASFDAGDFAFCWKPTASYKSARLRNVLTLYSVIPKQDRKRRIINHFPSTRALTTKTGLYRTLRAYYKAKGGDVNSVVPRTFIVSTVGTDQWDHFVNYFEATCEAADGGELRKMRSLFICKPANMNCGKGIQVLDQLELIKKYVKRSLQGAVILQQYIKQPFLYKKRKFDIRLWVLVTQEGAIYVAREGYLRTSSFAYTTELNSSRAVSRAKRENDHTLGVHLTNYSLQRKYKAKIGLFEEGNYVSFESFQDYLDEIGVQISVREDLFPRFVTIIIDSIRAAFPSFNAHGTNPYTPLELFGFDFLLDADLKVWLLEVNANPFLGKQSEHHTVILKQMASSLIDIIESLHLSKQTESNSTGCKDAEFFINVYNPSKRRHKSRA